MNELLLTTLGPKGDKVADLTGQWTGLSTTFPNFGTYPAWCQVGRYIYILNGVTSNTSVPFYRLDLETRTYTQLNGPSRPSTQAEMQYADGKIYVFDGYGYNTAAGYIWVYTIETNSWSYITAFNTYGARGRGRSFFQNNKLYNIGGVSGPPGNGVYFSDEIYDLSTNLRSESGRIISEYTGNGGKGVLIGNKFYYGRAYAQASDAVYCYDIPSRTITKLAPNPYAGPSASAAGGIGLCEVNGYLAQRNGTEVHFYDLATDSWEQLPAIGTAPTFNNGSASNIWAYYGRAIYNYNVLATTAATKVLWMMT